MLYIGLSADHELPLYQKNGRIQIRRVTIMTALGKPLDPYEIGEPVTLTCTAARFRTKARIIEKRLERIQDIIKSPEQIKLEGFSHISQLREHYDKRAKKYAIDTETIWVSNPLVWVLKIVQCRQRREETKPDADKPTIRCRRSR